MASYYMINIVFSHAFHNVIAPHIKLKEKKMFKNSTLIEPS